MQQKKKNYPRETKVLFSYTSRHCAKLQFHSEENSPVYTCVQYQQEDKLYEHSPTITTAHTSCHIQYVPQTCIVLYLVQLCITYLFPVKKAGNGVSNYIITAV